MSEIVGERQFREKPDISQVFIRQLDRINHIGAMDYQTAVEQTLSMLPESWREWVYQNHGLYEVSGPTLFYIKNCGKRMGRADAPLLEDDRLPVKRLKDDSIDWSDPNIISPYLKDATNTNYVKMFQVVMTAAEYAGLTWQTERTFVDGGDTIEHIEKRKRTPFRIPRVIEDDEEKEG